jgi:hypothetical protein
MSTRRRITTLAPLVFLAAALAAHADEAVSAAPPAIVANPVGESALTTIALTPQAEQRLGVAVAPAAKRALPRTRLLAGQVIAPLGAGSEVAPVATPATEAEAVRVAEAQVAAEGAVAVARARLDGARRSLARAQRMLADDAGSEREVDDARTQVAVAEAALAGAQRQRALLGPAGASADGARLWVRVPVYASEAREIDTAREARVGDPSGSAEPSLRAQPVRGAPRTRSVSPAVDVLYEVRDAARELRIGQQVGVRVPLRGARDGVVVPASALLYDAEGGTWVYERVAPQTYARRRVQIEAVVDADAALVGEALAGREVVVAGAAELFGTEFGAGK